MAEDLGIGPSHEHTRLHTEQRHALQLLDWNPDIAQWIAGRRQAIDTIAADLPPSRGENAVPAEGVMRAALSGGDKFLQSTLDGHRLAVLRFSLITYSYVVYDMLYASYGTEDLSGRLVVLYGPNDYCEPVYWRVPDQPEDRSPRIDQTTRWGVDISNPPFHTD